MSKDIRFFNPSIFYKKHKDEFDAAIFKILDHGGLVTGVSPEIEEFEKNFAAFTGAKHVIATGSGTHSLALAYKAAGIGPGDEVITTSHTFVATIDQIKLLGATPVLVDIGIDGLIDPFEVRKAITPRTKAIVPVHLEGKVCNMRELLSLAKMHNLIVIEDAAQAVGATFEKSHVGTLGLAGCFSFFPAKIMGSFGNAGAVITNNDELAAKVRLMRCNGNIGKNPDLNAPLGGNYEIDGLQCAILGVVMKYLPMRLRRREEVSRLYDEHFSGLPGLSLPLRQGGRVYQDYVITFANTETRDEFARYIKEKGVGILGHNLTPNHWYTNLASRSYLPKTDKYVTTQVRLAMNPDLSDEEVAKVIQTVKDFYLVGI